VEPGTCSLRTIVSARAYSAGRGNYYGKLGANQPGLGYGVVSVGAMSQHTQSGPLKTSSVGERDEKGVLNVLRGCLRDWLNDCERWPHIP